MNPYSIYIVDDEATIREGVAMALEADYQVETFSTAETAISDMENNPPDLVLLDIGLPGMDGVEALRSIKGLYPEMLVIMITAFEDIDTVISAMKLGAYDYVVKPLHLDSLEVTIANALQTITLRKEVQILQEGYLKENLPFFISKSNVMQDVMEFVNTVAKSPDTPILIIGETGTGKELLARAIHYRSPNFKGPLVTMNCAAIPKDLIESELFGYEKGAFSGAKASGKKGLIEAAADGTLFLDEVGDLSLEAQAKLLRFLETGEFYRVGGTKQHIVQTRVVSATNKDVKGLIEKDLFRNDLYFRLAVVNVQVPSLNERSDDIMPLAKHFLMEFTLKFGKAFTGISSDAENALITYNWVGHVRELKNLIERGVLVGKGPILEVDDLGIEGANRPAPSGQAADQLVFPALEADGIDLDATQESLEKYYIEAALKIAEGNESKAAKLLHINHHTFRYRNKKLQIK
ncbi:MAG: sigma-54-dependent Fis family transcriptional regulator [Deltaproteobacteria bacterium]|nr:sigma-54-dependent Fis family transcriptional regulator [Deltaproteobacteria bacterium]